MRPLWKTGLATLLLTAVISGINALKPLSGKALVDVVLMRQEFDRVADILRSLGLAILAGPLREVLSSVNLVVLFGIAASLLLGLISIAQNMLTFRFNNEITFYVQTELFDRVLRYPLSILKERQVGYVMSRVTGDVHAVQAVFSQFLTQILAGCLTPVFSFIVLFKLSPRLTLLLLALLPLGVLFQYLIMVRSRALSYRQMEGSAHVSGHIQQALAGVEVIKSFGAEEQETRRLSEKLRDVLKLQLKSIFLSSFAGYVMSALNLAVKLFVFWYCARAVLKGSMTVGDLASFSWYAMSLYGTLTGLFNQLLSLQYLFVSLGRLHEMFSVVPEVGKGEGRKGLIPDDGFHGDIEFENVRFGYDEARPVLEGLSLAVRPGETVAITGLSGAGKTTLISLLIKFYRPQAGRIRVGGIDLNDVDTRWLREQIGIVSQETFLFDDTIEHNIRYGRQSAGTEDVVEAARKARVDHDIASFPAGYGTVVGERGAHLSLGQRQRVSLARAFLKNPPFLILDEPTSALDRETESALAESLKEITKGRTAIIISHRQALLDVADRVVSLEDGTIREVTAPDRAPA